MLVLAPVCSYLLKQRAAAAALAAAAAALTENDAEVS